MSEPQHPQPQPADEPRVSGLAPLASALGVFSCPCLSWWGLEKLGVIGPRTSPLVLLAIPVVAAAVGIVGIVRIYLSRGRVTGMTACVLSVLLSILWVVFSFMALLIGGWGASKG